MIQTISKQSESHFFTIVIVISAIGVLIGVLIALLIALIKGAIIDEKKGKKQIALATRTASYKGKKQLALATRTASYYARAYPKRH